MNTATGFAMARMHKARTLVTTVLVGLALAACGGGAETVDNPLPQNPGGPTQVTYNGLVGPRDSNVNAFLQNFWTPMQNSASCGNCHNDTTLQTPTFARFDDINMAHDEAVLVTDQTVPALSRLVSKVGEGHNCWLADPQACSDIMTTWIQNWVSATGTSGGRQIVLTPPPIVDPGASKNYANATAENFRDLVYTPYLEQYCSGCHSSGAPTAQAPYFAETGAVDSYLSAYEAAKSKMDLNDPAASRFVLRLSPEFHNCWSQSCTTDSAAMLSGVQAFADTVPITQLDPALVNSKALRLVDGVVASGGNRFENSQIALWEFKTGSGTVAYDTSGVAPAVDLTLSGEYEWFGGWGVTFNGGRAQGTTSTSSKLHDRIRATGEFSIEAWVVPANVTQEMARIVTYSAGDTARNMTLQQTLYNYDFLNRTTETNGNGDPQLSTPDADEVLQATLQHVVATYSAIDGRSIYVNGQLVTQTDPVQPGTLVDWDDTFAFVLGSEAGGTGPWLGTVRMAAVHEFALTPEQIQQNFDVGVGEKFYMLFSIEDIINVPTSYILFEVAQFDSYSYLFTQPHFITLDAAQSASGIPLQGMRIGVNGAEVDKSQTYANVNDNLDTALFQELGQPLSTLGAVMPLERGPDSDEFFLTFDLLGSESYVRTDDPPLVITESDLPPAPRVGVRTFDEINMTFSAVTGVSPEDTAVDMTYQSLRQSLPAIENPQAFLSSHQVALAQLAFEYCDALMEDRGTISTATMFPAFDFSQAPATAYANRDALIQPLVDRLMGVAIMSQPDYTVVRDELGFVTFDPVTLRPDNLIDRMLAPNPDPTEPQADTRGIAKGACGAVLGSAIALVQ